MAKRRNEPVEGFQDAELDAALYQENLRSLTKQRDKRLEARREEVLTLRMAGLSMAQIGEKLGISPPGVLDLINRTLENYDTPTIREYRKLENARLDRAQAAIWADVLKGDHKAIDVFLRISSARRRLNGLDAPLDISLSVTVRKEMEVALEALERIVLGQVIPGEVINDGGTTDSS